MIIGNKPGGYVVMHDLNANKLERETRTCTHCGFSWIYEPGKKKLRGFCHRCWGLLCARPECFKNHTCDTAELYRD